MTSKTKQCGHCDATFQLTRADKKFCSTACQQSYNLLKRRKERRDINKPFICEECGKEIKRARTNGRFPRFCGMRCRQDRDIRERKELKEGQSWLCAHCGKRYFPTRTDRLYCSSRCAQRNRARRKGVAPILPPQVRLVNGLRENKRGCWEWQGSVLASGYGSMSVENVRVVVHRYLWELLSGPIPEGIQIDHLCRNRICCNPAHLDPVTQQENLRRSRITAEAHFALRHGKAHPGDQWVTTTLDNLIALINGNRDHIEKEE